VPYQPGDPETDVQDLGSRVAEAFKTFEKESGKKLDVWFVDSARTIIRFIAADDE
jgi:diaminopimelate decarboxylase